MDINSRLAISYYKTVAVIDEEHKVYVVQHNESRKIYIKKILSIYNKNIYDYLRQNPIPYTPYIYEIYEENQELIIIEEYISGETLEQIIEDKKYLSEEQIRNIMCQLCTIVSCFHNCSPQIIHRDIKPSNIIINPSGKVYLLDFNAAKYYSEQQEEDTRLLGTKGYAAPEQYGFGSSSVQTDIYAIGMVLNTLIKGEFSATIPEKSQFTPIIKKCIKLDAKERYKDVNSILKLLNNDNNSKNKMNSDIPYWRTFLPPGFRKLSPVSMIMATIGYVFIFWLSLTLNIKDASITRLWFERLFSLAIFLGVFFFSGNYRNVQNVVPLCNSKNPLIKLISIIVIDFCIIILSVSLMVLLEIIFLN